MKLKKKRIRKTDQKPAAFPNCAKSGIVTRIIALSIKVDTILMVKEYFPP